jgi:hypothetical protein
MQADIHPNYTEIDVSCSCGNKVQDALDHGQALADRSLLSSRPSSPASRRSSIPPAASNASARRYGGESQ